MQVSALHRYAVKGLSPDSLSTVNLTSNRFPDDRRYALHQTNKRPWKEKWLHKENFLCAFTHPDLLAKFQSSYDSDTHVLEIADRSSSKVLLKVDMNHESEKLAAFLSEQSGVPLICLSGGDFQFGNTHLTAHEDTNARTIHVVFSSTVSALAAAIGAPLNPSRFRPNIIVETDAPPFAEFSYVGHMLVAPSGLTLKVIDKSVRCQAVTVDPLDPATVMDIPELLTQHFPQHGPHLGVYCTVEKQGVLSVGDTLELVKEL